MSNTAAPGDTATPPAHRFACERRGVDYRFDPVKGQLVCPRCGHQGEMAQAGPWMAPVRDLDFETALRGSRTWRRWRKPASSNTPTAVRGWNSTAPPARLWFALNGLRDHARKGRRMQGIHVPCWTFDAMTEPRYRGERGTVHHENRSVMRDGKRQQVREARVRWQPFGGRVARAFDDVLVLASKGLPKRYADALEPWDLRALEPYCSPPDTRFPIAAGQRTRV